MATHPPIDWNKHGSTLLLILQDHVDLCNQIIGKDKVEDLSPEQMERYFKAFDLVTYARG